LASSSYVVLGMALNCNRWWDCSPEVCSFWTSGLSFSHGYSLFRPTL